MIKASSLRNIMEMRAAIEQKSAVLAVERATDEELDELREIVLKSEQHTGEDDLDFYFHYRLVELSGNSIFMGIVNTYFNEIREIRDRNLKSASHRFEVQKEHLAIVDAICSRNQVAAAQAVEAHMVRIWERWRQRNTGAVEDN
jgi:DNA-binding FadR family transcriptional regulator